VDFHGHQISYHAGVEVHGDKIQNVAVMNRKFHEFDAGDGDAHPIVVRGTAADESDAVQGVLIEGNAISNMKTGSRESISIVGNVMKWQSSKNYVGFSSEVLTLEIATRYLCCMLTSSMTLCLHSSVLSSDIYLS
jgi:hypothetical protein